MATTGSVKAKIQGLIDKSNETTGKSDATMTDAVNSLITQCEEGGISGVYAVNFYNDDRTTLLYTVYVPTGSSAIYAGETPISTEDATLVFAGFDPKPEKVTEDTDCYAVYESAIGTLDETSWENISKVSADGTAQNYFAVGDTKMIHIEGNVGAEAVNGDYGVYIIGFNHNSEIEGNGITFSLFRMDGRDSALLNNYTTGGSVKDGTKTFNPNHWTPYNYGGWAACDMRYDILGSTDKKPSGYGAAKTTSAVGYDASATCATEPVEDTLMAALPEDLRAVMKPMEIYSNNQGNKNATEAAVTKSIDYLPLLSLFEVTGATDTVLNSYEPIKQKQYDYYKAGNSRIRYALNKTYATYWWTRSVIVSSATDFAYFNNEGNRLAATSSSPYGIAPIFRV